MAFSGLSILCFRGCRFDLTVDVQNHWGFFMQSVKSKRQSRKATLLCILPGEDLDASKESYSDSSLSMFCPCYTLKDFTAYDWHRHPTSKFHCSLSSCDVVPTHDVPRIAFGGLGAYFGRDYLGFDSYLGGS